MVYKIPFSQTLYFGEGILMISLLWSGTENQLLQFYSLNTSDDLRFTVNYDDSCVSFLDIRIIRDGKKIITDLYRKPTDRNTLLHGQSYHPTTLKRSLPISQFKRIRRICSSEQSYAQQSTDLINRFRVRGHNEDWIQSAVGRFENENQETSLYKKRSKSENKTTVCVVQYSPICSDIKKIIDKHWYVLKSDPLLSDIFEKMPRFVYKRSSNIRDLLVRADVSSSVERPSHFLSIPSGNYSCGRCAQCNFTTKTNVFYHPHSGREFKIKGVITCTTKMLFI